MDWARAGLPSQIWSYVIVLLGQGLNLPSLSNQEPYIYIGQGLTYHPWLIYEIGNVVADTRPTTFCVGTAELINHQRHIPLKQRYLFNSDKLIDCNSQNLYPTRFLYRLRLVKTNLTQPKRSLYLIILMNFIWVLSNIFGGAR